MASFQAKICCKRQRKRENKKFSICFVPTRPVIEIPKKQQKKFKKLKNAITASFQDKIGWKGLKKERK